jgi:DNA-binding transcriptional MerR regulator
MKISELSQTSQVPVPTIKFFIREGLLPAGQRTSKNQATYESTHLERLALIRALQDAGLRLDVIARSLRAADNAREHFTVAAIDALERPVAEEPQVTPDAYARAQSLLFALIRKRGWKLAADDVSVRDAVRALCTIRRLFLQEEPRPEDLEVYVHAVELMAAKEIPADWQPDASREDALRYAMLGTVLFEPLILALRRMAHVARAREIVKAKPAAPARPAPRARTALTRRRTAPKLSKR